MLWPSGVAADIAIPTETKIYFRQDGQPYNYPVDYNIRCYGYEIYPQSGDVPKIPGTYTPEEVFTMNGSCETFGCVDNNSVYTNYRHIDYCDLEGTTQGKDFVISNYDNYPVSNCNEEGLSLKCELNFDLPTDLDVENRVSVFSWWGQFICWLKTLIGLGCT